MQNVEKPVVSKSNLSEAAKTVNDCCRECITPLNQRELTRLANQIAAEKLSPDDPLVIDACIKCTQLESEALIAAKKNPQWPNIVRNYYSKLANSLRSSGELPQQMPA